MNTAPAPATDRTPIPASPPHGIAQPSVALTGALAGLATWLLYHFVFNPAADTPIGAFFACRGLAQPAIVLFGLWCLAILALKAASIARQRRALSATLAALELPEHIDADQALTVLDKLQLLPRSAKQSHLTRRLVTVLNVFRLRRAPAPAADALREEAATDAHLVDRSMSHVRLLGWALPLTGMIGTLFGLGQAVGGLAQAFASAVDLQALQAAMPSLTGGLGTAFDVTLLGLATCVLVMVPSTWLHHIEEGLLGRVDAYCRHAVLPRLSDDADHAAAKLTAAVVVGWQRANAEMQHVMAERSLQWSEEQFLAASKVTAELTAAGRSIATAMQSALATVQQDLLTGFQELGQSIRRSTEESQNARTAVLGELRHLQGSVADRLQTIVDSMDSTARSVVETMLLGIAETGKKIGDGLAAPVAAVVDSLATALDKHVGALGRLESDVRPPVTEAIRSLAELVASLRTELPALLERQRATAEDSVATAGQLLALNESFAARAAQLNHGGQWLTDVRGLGGNLRRLEQRLVALTEGLSRQRDQLPRKRAG